MVRNISIRNLVMGVVVAMGGMLTLLSLYDINQAWTTLNQVQAAGVAVDIDRSLFEAMQAMRFERGDTFAVVSVPIDQAVTMRPAILANRAKVDKGVSSALGRLDMIDASGLAAIAGRLKATYQEQQAVRALVDAAVQLAPEARDKSLRGKVLDAGQRLTDEMENVVRLIETEIRRFDPNVSALIAVKNYAWTARLNSGDSVIMVNTALATRRPWTPAELQSMNESEGRAAALWQLVRESVVRPGIPGQLAAAADVAQREYFSAEFTDRIKGLRQAIMNGTDPHITTPEWLKILTPRITTVGMVAQTAIDLAVAQSVDKAAEARTNLLLNALLLSVTIALMAGGFLVAQFRIAKPLTALAGSMRSIAAGNLDVALTATDRSDEIGTMAKALAIFKDAAIEKKHLEEQTETQRQASEAERAKTDAERHVTAERQAVIVETLGRALGRLAKGDLTCEMTEPFAPEYERLRTDFNAAVTELRSTIGTIVVSIGTIQSGAAEMTQGASDLSHRTEQQAASLEETAAALDEITATVRKTAEGANAAHEVAAAAKAEATQSEIVVRDAVSAMSAIDQSASEIGQIIGVIDEIAFQTNLLALNAGVEAARAGDAGRGFAVVASEVRALAQRSAQAAKEIKALISNSASQVGRGVKLVSDTGISLGRILTHVRQINDAVAEIASSVKEQASGLAQVNTAVNQMDQVTQQNAAMVEQSTAASYSLAQDAVQLQTLTTRFEIGTGGATGTMPNLEADTRQVKAPRRKGDFHRKSA